MEVYKQVRIIALTVLSHSRVLSLAEDFGLGKTDIFDEREKKIGASIPTIICDSI